MESKAVGYNYNLFSYPYGYFRDKSAEDLGITEEERQMFINAQEEASKNNESDEEKRAKYLSDFESELDS